MDQTSIDTVGRSLIHLPSRRDVLRGLAAAGLGLEPARRPLLAAARCAKLGSRCKTKRGKKRCCGGATCQGARCRCPAGREPCQATCCAKGSTCDAGMCVPCDVCRGGCAFRSVQAAIDAADPGETIRLCPGTHRGHVVVAKNLTLLGAGMGRSVLAGDQAGSESPVLTIEAEATVEVRALTITGGGRDGAPPYGGGVLNRGALTLDGVDVRANRGDDGGGIAHLDGTLALTDCRVTGNQAQYAGGGLYVVAGTVTLTGSHVTGNQASVGGGIFNPTGTVSIEPESVTGNTPTNCAGQVVTNCVN